jgi:hypothetical protein
MRQTPWDHARQDLPTPEKGVLPATSEHAPVPPLRQAGAVGASEMYYAYHLGRVVKQHHHRLCATYHPAVDRNYDGC